MATYEGQQIAIGATIAGVVLEDASGAEASPEFPQNADHRVRGLVLDDGETWVQTGASDGRATIAIVAMPARERTRRGLRASVRALREAVRDGDVCDPQHTQRLLLAVVRDVLGED